jgi:UDP-3-O-[3-hydroxymyristoyl] glucosamine N-acyltransferase
MSHSPPAPPAGTSFSTAQIAGLLRAELIGPGDVVIRNVERLDSAGPEALTFIRSNRFAQMWPACKASAVLVTRGVELPPHPDGPKAVLIVPDADLALIALIDAVTPKPPPRPAGVHPTAVIDPSAKVHPSVHVGPQCHIEAGAFIDEGSVLISGVYVGPMARIGKNCTLHPRVCFLDRCVLGDRCTILAGTVIGSDGFGYRPDPDGPGVVKIPHVGNVVIESDVEIGSCTTIDRAKFGSTLIGAGTKIDNLCQIAHGVRIGKRCLLAAQVGIAGSAMLGDDVNMGGQVGVGDSFVIGAGAQIAGKGGVMKSLPGGARYGGIPARPAMDWLRELAYLKKAARPKRKL